MKEMVSSFRLPLYLRLRQIVDVVKPGSEKREKLHHNFNLPN